MAKKAIKSATARVAQRKLTDAEIKEAVERDKEWMNRIDPDEEIEVPKGMLKDIFSELNEKLDDEDADDTEDTDLDDADGEIGDEDDAPVDVNDDEDADADNGTGGGKVVGALIGGIGGLVLGSVLGAAILGDD